METWCRHQYISWEDGRVRRVQVQYKNPKPGEAINKYHEEALLPSNEP